jgi:hypothetical protein
VAGVGVQDDRHADRAGDPVRDCDGFGQRVDLLAAEASVGADFAIGADETRFGAGFFHHARQAGAGRVHDRQHPVSARDQLLQTCRRLHGIPIVGCQMTTITAGRNWMACHTCRILLPVKGGPRGSSSYTRS